jgi:hypothetical protein
MRLAALLVLTIATAAQAQTTLFLDTFTGSDATYLLAHTPNTTTSGGWSLQNGSAFIYSNQWTTNSGAPGGIGVIATCSTAADGEITAKTGTTSGTSGGGIVLRYASGGTPSFLLVNLLTTGEFRVYSYNGSWTQLATSTVTYAAGKVIKARLEGTSLIVSYDGVQKMSVTTSVNLTSTLHGLQAGPSRTFDDFTIKTLAPDATPGPLAITNTDGVSFEVAHMDYEGPGSAPVGWPTNTTFSGDTSSVDIYYASGPIIGSSPRAVGTAGGNNYPGANLVYYNVHGKGVYFKVIKPNTVNGVVRFPAVNAMYWADYQAAINAWNAVNAPPPTSGTNVTPDDPSGIRVNYIGQANQVFWGRGTAEHEFTEFPRVFVREGYDADEWTVTDGVLEWRGDSIGDAVWVGIEPYPGVPARCYRIIKTADGGVAKIYSEARLFPQSTPFTHVRNSPAYSSFGLTIVDNGVLEDPEALGYELLPGATRLMLRSWDGMLDNAGGGLWYWHNNLGEFTEEENQLAILDRWGNWRAITFTGTGSGDGDIAWVWIYDRPRMPEVTATLHPFNAILDVNPEDEECGPGTDDVNCDGFDDLEKDSDGDGIPDHLDPDDDNDGKHDCGDSDADGQPNAEDDDDDNDGVPDYKDTDPDGDGLTSAQDLDDDGDCFPDVADYDQDGDQVPDYRDGDLDGDTIPNDWDSDMDGDGIPNADDRDNDSDGVTDAYFPDGLRRVKGSVTSRQTFHKNILGLSASQY